MKLPLDFSRLATAFLAAFIAAAGAPVALCAAMLDCPSIAPASSCHEESAAQRHCAPPRVEASDDCCLVVAPQPPPATPFEKAPTGTGFDTPPLAITVSIAPIASVAALAPVARPFQRSGRALLSLHHTLLI